MSFKRVIFTCLNENIRACKTPYVVCILFRSLRPRSNAESVGEGGGLTKKEISGPIFPMPLSKSFFWGDKPIMI